MIARRCGTCYRRFRSGAHGAGRRYGDCPLGLCGIARMGVLLRRRDGAGGGSRLRRGSLRGHAREAAVLTDPPPAAAARHGADGAEPRIGTSAGAASGPHGERHHRRGRYGCRHRASPGGRVGDANHPRRSGRWMDGDGHPATIHRAATRRPERDAGTAERRPLNSLAPQALEGRGRRVRRDGDAVRARSRLVEARGRMAPHVWRSFRDR